ncbi:flagellar hook-associated protein FlgL [Naasia aerilata]|uniref:Flagellar hook-associated protein FlgL n=1 Tax=Naasia aerilata TaxID=1162966 RepID=A0ABM8GA73_9MICO|nr:flagellar hook-associated protein FlgL [Naasia aerilata]BDZ45111.1 flagellar hook-associated protein FlgL [Naasia aerilata]
MIGRITNQQQLVSAQRNVQTSRALLSQLQEQAATGRAVTKPSDDPSATASIMRVHAQQRATEQYGTNISDGTAWLATVDDALSSSEDILRKVRDLTLRGANEGTMTPATRSAIAGELEGLKSDLLEKANTTYLGRTVFAGSSSAGTAFAATPAPYTFTGAAGATVQRRINDSETVRVDVDGAAAFGTGTGSVFALIDNIVTDLTAGTDLSARIGQLDTHVSALTTQHGVVGTRYSRLQQAAQSNLTQSTALEAQRAGLEDVDPAKAIIDLKSQEVTYQTALGVTARALQPTLLSYLQ